MDYTDYVYLCIYRYTLIYIYVYTNQYRNTNIFTPVLLHPEIKISADEKIDYPEIFKSLLIYLKFGF